MKKILKLTVLFFAISAIIVGCRKEQEKNSIIGTWTSESISAEIQFSNQVDPIQQFLVNALLEKFLSDRFEGTFQFFDGGKVVRTDRRGSIEGTYTTVDGILTMYLDGLTVRVAYNISGNKLHLYQETNISDISDILGDFDFDLDFDLDLDLIGVTGLSLQVIFVRQ